MNHCARCTRQAKPLPTAGTLYLAPSPHHDPDRLRGFLQQNDWRVEEPIPNLFAILLDQAVLRRFCNEVERVLTHAELQQSRSLFTTRSGPPVLEDLIALEPLATLLARARGIWLQEILNQGRLTNEFQPIVHAREPDRVFAYECLLRGVGVDGSRIAPDELYKSARDADLLFALDRAARLTAIENAITHGLDAHHAHLFINFNPTSIYDPSHCLRSTAAAIANSELRPEQIVFEVVESDQIEDIPHLVGIVDYYRNSGFKVALDDLGSGYGSLNLLGGLRPDYVKLDMQLVRAVDRDPYRSAIVRRLLDLAQDLGIETIAEGIETEEELEWVSDHGADYIQGYHIARPGSPPPFPACQNQQASVIV